MSFLAPLFLLGTLAIAGPVIFHLIRRTTKEVVPFSSLMFLLPTPPRITRRSRLEHLWLLLLRALVILLLALGFGRPLLQRMVSANAAGNAGRRTVVLVDASASMRREDLWKQATTRVAAVLGRLHPEDGVAVSIFDGAVHPLVSFEDWDAAATGARVEMALDRLKGIQPSWSGTGLGPALLNASELLNTAPDSSRFVREIVVITDLQEGSSLEGLQGYEWPRGTEVTVETVQTKQSGNARADWIPGVEEGKPDSDQAIRVRVTNEEGEGREQLQLRWADGSAADTPTAVYVPPGQSRVVSVKAPAPSVGDRLILSGDETDFDDSTYVVPLRPETATVLFLGQDKEEDTKGSLFFLRRAFPATSRQKVEITVRPGTAALPPWELGPAQLMVLGEGVNDAAIASARSFAEGGRSVLLPLTSPESERSLNTFLGGAKLSVTEGKVKDYAMWSQIDFQDVLFAPFADPRYSDFSKIHFWKYRRVTGDLPPGTRALAKFDSGDPAILQVPVGKGNLIVLASSWRPADSQLALSSKFVPLLYAILGQSSGRVPRQEQYFVGEPVPMNPGAQPWVVTAPGGTKTEVAAGGKFEGTSEPGIYVVGPGAASFAVNLQPDESRTRPMPMERLLSLGVPAHTPQTSVAVSPGDAASRRVEDESRQKLWRWLIAAAVVILLGETLLAGALTRRFRPAGV